MEASDRTAHGRLHEQGFRCRIPAVKPLLNGRTRTEAAEVVQREERKKERKTTEQWSSVMFSDEFVISKFVISKFVISFGKKGPRVWEEKG